MKQAVPLIPGSGEIINTDNLIKYVFQVPTPLVFLT